MACLLPLSLTEVHKTFICIPQLMCYIILYASSHYRKILYSGFLLSWHIFHLSEDGANICSQTVTSVQ